MTSDPYMMALLAEMVKSSAQQPKMQEQRVLCSLPVRLYSLGDQWLQYKAITGKGLGSDDPATTAAECGTFAVQFELAMEAAQRDLEAGQS